MRRRQEKETRTAQDSEGQAGTPPRLLVGNREKRAGRVTFKGALGSKGWALGAGHLLPEELSQGGRARVLQRKPPEGQCQGATPSPASQAARGKGEQV